MLCRQILATMPTHHDSINLLGEIAGMSGRDDAALALFGDAVKLKPSEPRYQYNLGSFLLKANRFEEAAQCFRRSVKKKPDFALAHGNLGHALAQLGQLQQAVTSYRAALRFDRNFAQAHSNLGHALRLLGDYEGAAAAYSEAFRSDPGMGYTRIHLASALVECGRLAEARARYQEADGNDPRSNDPRSMEARLALAQSLLRTGLLQEGWQVFEARRYVETAKQRHFPVPLWDGMPAGERRIMVHAEEGLGDTLQFCRFAPLLAGRGRIVLSVQQSLVRLLAALPGIDQVVAETESPATACDMYLPLLSAPRVLGTVLETIPASVPYLHADPRAVAAWRRLSGSLPGLKVGLVWAGNPKFPSDRRRSLSLAHLVPLASVPGVRFVSLQKGESASQAQTVPEWTAMEDWTDAFADFADTAALVEALDLVIGVDTSLVHLAGALGKPVWLLNRFDTDWRWLLDRNDSPWYPTLRQFRQPRAGDWETVVQNVREALIRLVADSEQGSGSAVNDEPSEGKDIPPALLNAIDRLVQRAAAEYGAGRLDRAERLCRHALILAPAHTGSQHLLEALLRQTGCGDRARN